MFVKNFMTREIITVDAEEKAGSALQLMREQGLRRMPVVSAGGEIVGMITDRRPAAGAGRAGAPRRVPALGRDAAVVDRGRTDGA